MKKAKYFKIHELVPPQVYKDRGVRAWELIDSRLIDVIDALREEFGPATINSWKWGGKFKWSGLRTASCKIGAKYSQHRFGRAADLKFKNFTPKQIRQFIREFPPHWAEAGIQCIENKTGTWLHVDVRNCTPIKWINP